MGTPLSQQVNFSKWLDLASQLRVNEVFLTGVDLTDKRHKANLYEQFNLSDGDVVEQAKLLAFVKAIQSQTQLPQQVDIPLDTESSFQQLPSRLIDAATTSLLTEAFLSKNEKLIRYVQAAKACEGKADVEEIWRSILGLQGDDEFADVPSPFTCVIASSGMGKTQLAATTAVLKGDANVYYFYTGDVGGEAIQPFYRSHRFLWRELKPILESLRMVLRMENQDLPGATAILDLTRHHLVFQYLNYIFFKDQSKVTVKELRKKIKLMNQELFVFMDEVPPEESYLSAMMLRDCFRALGVAPVLMSTHSGAFNGVSTGNCSRLDDVPQLWCQVITNLPSNHLTNMVGYLFRSERPLVHAIVTREIGDGKEKDLKFCVDHIKRYLTQTKPGAWKNSSLFQLCQLFRTKTDENGPMKCLHRLVGEHFGHLKLEEQLFDRNDVHLIEDAGRVKMPMAEEEPLLFLALTTWSRSRIDGNLQFPLVNKKGEALSVRSVFDENQSAFSSRVFIGNPAALKLNGNLLEVLSLASVTLASLQSDNGILSRNLLHDFIANVFCFMTSHSLTIQYLQDTSKAVHKILSHESGLSDILKMSIPPFPSAESQFPDSFVQHSGQLKRPLDSEKQNGAVQVNERDLIHIDCKNYPDGLSTSVLEKIINKFQADCKIFFIFTSKVNGLWSKDLDLGSVLAHHGLSLGSLCFLCLSSKDGAINWLQSLDGLELKPNNDCKGLVVIFAIDIMKSE